MLNLFNIIKMLSVIAILSGCVADDNKKVVVPRGKAMAIYDNGSIFKPGFNERPLYEERRARNVGDGLIMNVAEVAKSPKKNENNAEGDSSGGSRERVRRDETDADLSNIDSNVLAGNINLTVLEVLDNGNLYVTGGKQVIVDHEYKYVRISGVVDPANIVGGNVIQSTQVSEVNIQVDDVRIRADRTAVRVSEGQNVLGGLFQSMKPE